MQLTDIYIYPVKSLAGLRVASAKVDIKGLEKDRRWMLVDPNGVFLTQRNDPAMALIDLNWENADRTSLVLTHRTKSMPPLILSLNIPDSQDFMEVQIWDDTVSAILIGAKYDHWFSEALNRPCHLVYMPETDNRRVDPRYALSSDSVSFADGFPYLLVNQASFSDLNSRLEQAVEVERFRPNFVFDGQTPWEEDQWSAFRIGQVAFRSLKPCARCVLTTVDPLTGKKGTEPLKTLSSFRKKGNKVLFGMNACWDFVSTKNKEQEVRIGDELAPEM